MSDDNILRVVPFEPHPDGPNPHLVRDLESLLDAAKAGRVTGIAGICVRNSRQGGPFATTFISGGDRTGERHVVLAGVTFLSSRLQGEFIQLREQGFDDE